MPKKASLEEVLKEYQTKSQEVFYDTGIECLNEILGGGISNKAMYAFWGPQGSGKSTLCFQIAKNFCKQGKKVLFIDVEKAFNSHQQEAFGLKKYADDGTLLITTVSNYAQLETITDAVPGSDISLMIIDSETMITPSVKSDLKVTDVQPGLKARQSSFLLTKIKESFWEVGIPSIILFHARTNINMNGGTVPDTKQAGGYTALHVPDVILHITTGAKVKDGDQIVGQIIRMVTEKNKFTKPFQTIEKKFIYGTGISKRIDLIDSAIAANVITMAGAGFYTLPWGDKIRGTKALYELTNEQLVKLRDLMNAK